MAKIPLVSQKASFCFWCFAGPERCHLQRETRLFQHPKKISCKILVFLNANLNPPKYKRNTSKNCQPIQSTTSFHGEFWGNGHLPGKEIPACHPSSHDSMLLSELMYSGTIQEPLPKGAGIKIIQPNFLTFPIQLVDTSVAMLDFRRVLLSLPFKGIRPSLLWVVPSHWTLDLLYCQSGL